MTMIACVCQDYYCFNMYAMCVKAGTFTSNQFDVCPQRLFTDADLNHTKLVTFHQAVSHESKCRGQGSVRFNCAGPKRCKCFKHKIQCSSRCHGNIVCKNK